MRPPASFGIIHDRTAIITKSRLIRLNYTIFELHTVFEFGCIIDLLFRFGVTIIANRLETFGSLVHFYSSDRLVEQPVFSLSLIEPYRFKEIIDSMAAKA